MDPKKQLAKETVHSPSETSTSSTSNSKAARQLAEVEPKTDTSTCEVVKATKNLNIVRSSKFRHIEGYLRDRSSFVTKFPSLSSTVPGDSNAFQVCT